jgi:recombinational DNA repair ATPase RecF
MTERIERLEIRAFRGVSDALVIDLAGGRSLLVFGDNATGKSTIADAIEWFLTGRIEYLTKENRSSGLRSAASDPGEETSVMVQTTGELGGRMTLDAGPRPEVADVAAREYCLLRGRDLTDFVEKTKGEKWGALARILGLEPAEAFRKDLYSARRGLRGTHRNAQEELRKRAEAIERRSEITNVNETSILDAAVALCQQAGIDSPHSFAEATDEAWLDEQLAGAGATQRHGALRALHAEMTAIELNRDVSALDGWNEFVETADVETKSRLAMLNNAQELVREQVPDECPLCGQSIDAESLRARIERALEEMHEAARTLDGAVEDVSDFLTQIEGVINRLEGTRARGAEFGLCFEELPASPLPSARKHVDDLEAIDPALIDDHAQRLKSWLEPAVELVDQAAPQLPEGRESTLSNLTELTVLARQWNERRHEAAAIGTAKELAERIYHAYAAEQEQHMTAVLHTISQRVADLYASLHPGEGLDDVSIETMGEKGVELAVDFYGERRRPPQQVLSESHMNSLGLAVFLAMHDTYNERLGFLVLDDVVNSFDIEHRGALAHLLATEYENTQLIVLTHDPQFYTRLSRQAPEWKREEFLGWDYEHGPRTRSVGDEPLLDRARMLLDDDDKTGAGQRARRALEELLLDACECLEAPLPFRRGTSNDRREATELLNGLRRALKANANQFRVRIEPLLKEIEGDLQAALNVEAHAGSGHSSRNEIDAAIERIRSLRSHWTCPDCETAIWFVGNPNAGRCKCGAHRFPPVE